MFVRRFSTILLLALGSLQQWAVADDWPTWRHDAARTAVTAQRLPETLHLQWVRKLPPLRPAFWLDGQERVQFDRGYEPVVLGKTMFVGSSLDDSVRALDTETGSLRWQYFTDGPVRCAPVAAAGRLFAASDDGCLHALDATNGRRLWKVRAAPSSRKVIGNGRLISVWPVRGAPVMADGQVYFVAGVWPFEGLFVYSVDAATGKVTWMNDRTGSMYIEHPHGAMSFGGPSPQGYLLVQGDELVVPSSRAFPAYFDRRTGRFIRFAFGSGPHGNIPASWFVAADVQGRLCVDTDINNEDHDAGRQIVGQKSYRHRPGEKLLESVTLAGVSYRILAGVRDTISAGGREFRCGQPPAGVNGPVHTMLAADDRLFVVGLDGAIYCFGANQRQPTRYGVETEPLPKVDDAWTGKVRAMLSAAPVREGYAVVLGTGSGRLVEELLSQTSMHVIVIEPDVDNVASLRQRLARAGQYGQRVVVHAGTLSQFGLPPYMANLIVAEDFDAASKGQESVLFDAVLAALHPFGGAACLELSETAHASLATWNQTHRKSGAEVRRNGAFSLLERPGPLPGATDYTGVRNYDQLVRAPMGLLWFGDTFRHHKLYWRGYWAPDTGRGLPQTIQVVNGVMRYATTNKPHGPNPDKVGYVEYLRYMNEKLSYLDAATDIYTGRPLPATQIAEPLLKPATPPGNDSNSEGGLPGPVAQPVEPVGRICPLTGIREGREVIKNHGCDLSAVDYGNMLTLRSGTGAFYDRVLDSGTINISGMRSGCRNNLVPAGGVLNVPSWTGNCTCNYPVYTSMALARMPDDFEQWAAWGGVAVDAPLVRAGFNFGAPGDRMTPDGTLWLDCPTVGGPSPDVPVRIEPPEAEPYYRHAMWISGGSGWPWVTASGIKGVRSIRIEPVAKRPAAVNDGCSVRWSGWLRAAKTEKTKLHVETDYAVRLWISDRLVLDNTRALWRVESQRPSVELATEAGKDYPIVLEYYGPKGRGTPAKVTLAWSSPSTPRTIVPADWLVTAEGTPGGLTGLYYENRRFTGPAVVRVDKQIDMAWPDGQPTGVRRSMLPVKAVRRPFTVRLFFAEPESLRPGQRVFNVKLQGRDVLHGLDVVSRAAGPSRGLVCEVKGVSVEDALVVEFEPQGEKPAIISGIEMVAEER